MYTISVHYTMEFRKVNMKPKGKNIMPLFTQEQIDSANKVDIAEFLSGKGVQLKKLSNQFVWEDRNVWIHGNEWYSHYEQTGGHAIDFVMKYLGRTFTEAVKELNGDYSHYDFVRSKEVPSPQLQPPKRSNSTYRMFMYLRNNRCISPDVINAFVKMGLLYEDDQYHCCIFVGRDDNGRYGHCHKRSTLSGFKQTLEGSKAEYAFHYNGADNTIYAFEAPIDMLAYISMHQDGWKDHSYVALCSVSDKALMHQLETHPNLTKIVLCLDNDNAGQSAVERIKEALCQKGYSDVQVEVPVNKDWDEDLQVLSGVKPGKFPKEVTRWTASELSSLSLS